MKDEVAASCLSARPRHSPDLEKSCIVRTMLATAGGGVKRDVTRGVVVLSLVATAVLVVQLGRMSVYMVDPAATGWSVMPWNQFGTFHNCFTGYWAATRDIETIRTSGAPTSTHRQVRRQVRAYPNGSDRSPSTSTSTRRRFCSCPGH